MALAEYEHFGRAAERLAISVSAVSKHCARLEQVLGVRLFYRSSRQVKLTTAGAVAARRSSRTLTEAEEFLDLAREAAEGCVGELTVAYSPGNGDVVARIVRVFRSRYPNVHLRLEQTLTATWEGRFERAWLRSASVDQFATRGLRKVVHVTRGIGLPGHAG